MSAWLVLLGRWRWPWVWRLLESSATVRVMREVGESLVGGESSVEGER